MGRKRKGASMTREEAATLIEAVSARIASRDQAFDIQLQLTTAGEALLELKHVEGLKLLNRIGLLLITQNGTKNVRYERVRKTVEKLTPLDAEKDSVALLNLAKSIRSES